MNRIRKSSKRSKSRKSSKRRNSRKRSKSITQPKLIKGQKILLKHLNYSKKVSEFDTYKLSRNSTDAIKDIIKLGMITIDSQTAENKRENQRAYLTGWLPKIRGTRVIYWINMYTDKLAMSPSRIPEKTPDTRIIVTWRKEQRKILQMTSVFPTTLATLDDYDKDSHNVPKSWINVTFIDLQYNRGACSKTGLFTDVIKCLKLSPEMLKQQIGVHFSKVIPLAPRVKIPDTKLR
jgi:hypothetical protein